MNAISAIRRTTQERVDGTLVVKLEIEPRYVQDFFRLFPQMDMQVAIAPLVMGLPDPEPTTTATTATPAKGGQLARLAGVLCGDQMFLDWLGETFGGFYNTGSAAQLIRDQCDVISRAHLDHDELAAERFHRIFRKPFVASMTRKAPA